MASMYFIYSIVPPFNGLTGWSSRRLSAALVGALRASHSGVVYCERWAPPKVPLPPQSSLSRFCHVD